ncbi:MAG: hypothetical protein ACK5T5_08785 [Phenylobacterium sp.]
MGRETGKPADGAAVLTVYLRPEGRRLAALALCLKAEDFKEGGAHFLESRPAGFTGR